MAADMSEKKEDPATLTVSGEEVKLNVEEGHSPDLDLKDRDPSNMHGDIKVRISGSHMGRNWELTKRSCIINAKKNVQCNMIEEIYLNRTTKNILLQYGYCITAHCRFFSLHCTYILKNIDSSSCISRTVISGPPRQYRNNSQYPKHSRCVELY